MRRRTSSRRRRGGALGASGALALSQFVCQLRCFSGNCGGGVQRCDARAAPSLTLSSCELRLQLS
eukprot:13579705-Alexandrium_andersonii.AAC.1